MIDLQLPRPLLDPHRWPSGDALMSIFSLKYGGAFLSRRGRSFVVPEAFWTNEGRTELSFVAVLRETRMEGAEIVSRQTLAGLEQIEWRELGAVSFRVDSRLQIPSLQEWSREVFPLSFTGAGEVTWFRELRDYEEQMGGGTPSLDRLRFWPSFLRARKRDFASTASVEWARTQALFSPQDDSRGSGACALMNPTLQVVTGLEQMLALWRVDGVFFEREISWAEAAVIDEMRETPRLPLSELFNELRSRKDSLPMTASFETVVNSMIEAGLILLRP